MQALKHNPPATAPKAPTPAPTFVVGMVGPQSGFTPAPASTRAAPATGYCHLHVTANPKKPGTASAARWACRQHGQTVAAYHAAVLAACGAAQAKICAGDNLWDARHGFITVAPAAPTGPIAPKPKA